MNQDKPTILQAAEDGELYDYLEGVYEMIDHEKHEKEVIEQ